MWNHYSDLAAIARRILKGEHGLRLAGDILLLAAFAVTSSWLIRP
jgi:hypothetical protein